jgi:toxin ParE1/3/4
VTCFHLTHDAKASLRHIALYTQQKWGVKQRQTYLKALDKCFHDLAIAPTKGKLRSEIHHHMRSYPQGSHVIYYLVQESTIVIVDILHKRMDPDIHIDIKH